MGELMENQILIEYDKIEDVFIKYDPEKTKETLDVLLTTFSGLLHASCGDDTELLYLGILEATEMLRKAPKTNFPEIEVAVEKEV